FEKRLNDGFVSLEKAPLADLLHRHEPRALQRGEVSRHRRLRQAAARVDLPDAYAAIERQLLLGKVGTGLLEPRENLAPHGIGQCLMDGVDIYRHCKPFGRSAFARHASKQTSIVVGRILYRFLAMYVETSLTKGAIA